MGILGLVLVPRRLIVLMLGGKKCCSRQSRGGQTEGRERLFLMTADDTPFYDAKYPINLRCTIHVPEQNVICPFGKWNTTTSSDASM